MSVRRFRLPALVLASTLGLSACAYGYGEGYGGYASAGYGGGYCDPYYDDCYGGGYHDPWYGWYDNYYYPGFGIYVYDEWRRPHRWNDYHRRFWEGRRSRWGDRNWNDRRWERWDGWDRRHWRGGDAHDGRDWRNHDRDGDRRRWRNRDGDGDGRRWRDRRWRGSDGSGAGQSGQGFRTERAEAPDVRQQQRSESAAARREARQAVRQSRAESPREEE